MNIVNIKKRVKRQINDWWLEEFFWKEFCDNLLEFTNKRSIHMLVYFLNHEGIWRKLRKWLKLYKKIVDKDVFKEKINRIIISKKKYEHLHSAMCELPIVYALSKVFWIKNITIPLSWCDIIIKKWTKTYKFEIMTYFNMWNDDELISGESYEPEDSTIIKEKIKKKIKDKLKKWQVNKNDYLIFCIWDAKNFYHLNYFEEILNQWIRINGILIYSPLDSKNYYWLYRNLDIAWDSEVLRHIANKISSYCYKYLI